MASSSPATPPPIAAVARARFMSGGVCAVHQLRSVLAAITCDRRRRLEPHEIRGVELGPERQGGETVRVGPLVLRHAREGGFADADFPCDLPPGSGPGRTLG